MFDHRPGPIGRRAKARLTSLCGCVRAAAKDVRGVAAIEFAVIVPVLLFMMVAIVDFGTAIYSDMEVQNAAQAGAQYAIAHGFNATSISSAVTNANNLPGMTVASGPTEFCGCATSTGVTTIACSSTCTGGSTPGTYVSLSARATYTTIVPYPLLPSSFTFTSPATVRIQ